MAKDANTPAVPKTSAEILAESLKTLGKRKESPVKSQAQIERETREASIQEKLDALAQEFVTSSEGTSDDESLALGVRRLVLAGEYIKKALAGVPDSVLDPAAV